jgi:CheY-like chemotaxis protein
VTGRESPQQGQGDTTPTDGTAAAPPAPPRVLVVDDAPTNRRFLARLLASHFPGAHVAEAAEGAAAVALALAPGGPGFDLVCMDREMPGAIDGLGAARALRKAGYSGLLLGCTGNASDAEAAEFIDAGADRVLVKPVDVVEVAALLRQYLRRRRRALVASAGHSQAGMSSGQRSPAEA